MPEVGSDGEVVRAERIGTDTREGAGRVGRVAGMHGQHAPSECIPSRKETTMDVFKRTSGESVVTSAGSVSAALQAFLKTSRLNASVGLAGWVSAASILSLFGTKAER